MIFSTKAIPSIIFPSISIQVGIYFHVAGQSISKHNFAAPEHLPRVLNLSYLYYQKINPSSIVTYFQGMKHATFTLAKFRSDVNCLMIERMNFRGNFWVVQTVLAEYSSNIPSSGRNSGRSKSPAEN